MKALSSWASECAGVLLLAVTIVALCAIPSAFAADAVVKWTAPTTNTDGTAIPATGTGALTSYLIEYGSCSTAAGVVPQVLGTVQGSLSIAAPTLIGTLTGLLNSTIYCVRVYALNAAAKSAASGTVRAWIPAPPAASIPGAPGSVTVTYSPPGTTVTVTPSP